MRGRRRRAASPRRPRQVPRGARADPPLPLVGRVRGEGEPRLDVASTRGPTTAGVQDSAALPALPVQGGLASGETGEELAQAAREHVRSPRCASPRLAPARATPPSPTLDALLARPHGRSERRAPCSSASRCSPRIRSSPAACRCSCRTARRGPRSPRAASRSSSSPSTSRAATSRGPSPSSRAASPSSSACRRSASPARARPSPWRR